MRRSGGGAGVRILAVVGAAVVGLAGCQAQSSIIPAHVPDPVVVIETASFAEAEIVGLIYGTALTRAGYRVTPRPQSGTQDEVVDAVTSGEATFTVGFTGELLSRFDPGSTATAAEEVYADMMAALPEGVTAADPAPAEDAPVYVVTEHTSATLGLRAMSDLAGRCGELTLGSREEMLSDVAITSSVAEVYDCGFENQVALGPNPRVVFDSLRAGQIGVGLVHSADPILEAEDMILLDDDEDALRAQHLVPVFRKGSLTEDQLRLVNRISGELTTDDVQELLLGVEFNEVPPEGLANFWLDEHGY